MPCPAPPRLNDHEALRLALLEAGLLLRSAHDDLERFDAARARLLAFCWERLVPHLEHDEAWLLAADTCPTGRLLADAMRTEARAMTAAVLELEGATDPCEAIGAVRALHALLAAHAHHEDLLATAGLTPGRST